MNKKMRRLWFKVLWRACRTKQAFHRQLNKPMTQHDFDSAMAMSGCKRCPHCRRWLMGEGMHANLDRHQIHFCDSKAFEDARLLGLHPDGIGYADLIFTFYRREDRDEAHKRLVSHGINCTADSD